VSTGLQEVEGAADIYPGIKRGKLNGRTNPGASGKMSDNFDSLCPENLIQKGLIPKASFA